MQQGIAPFWSLPRYMVIIITMFRYAPPILRRGFLYRPLYFLYGPLRSLPAVFHLSFILGFEYCSHNNN